MALRQNPLVGVLLTPIITKDTVSLDALRGQTLAVDGNATFRVFENVVLNVTISGFTITNGLGGILNTGGLTLSDSIVSNSRTFGANGGGIE